MLVTGSNKPTASARNVLESSRTPGIGKGGRGLLSLGFYLRVFGTGGCLGAESLQGGRGAGSFLPNGEAALRKRLLGGEAR